MNVRIAKNVDDEFIKVQDEYLKEEIKRKGIVDIDDLKPIKDGIYLWQGDITTLRCDAIVNAANSGMTGCYVPNHRCIDNCIHSFAGVQLRLECDEIMTKQGYSESTGQAKITNSYNLPCKYIIHTVGPIINGKLTSEDCDLLESCYKSCLEFHFPNDKAAQIAVKTVEEFMKKETSLKKVIFNVFKDMDKEIYRKLLK